MGKACVNEHDLNVVFRSAFLEEHRLAMQGLIDDLRKTNALFGHLVGEKIS